MEVNGLQMESKNQPPLPSSQALPDKCEIKTRVDSVWEKMNKGISAKTLNSIINSRSSTGKETPQKRKTSDNWMAYLGLGAKKKEAEVKSVSVTNTTMSKNETSDEAMKVAAAALAAVKDASASATAMLAKGKVEVTEIRDFAGQEIEVKKLVDASEKAKISAGPSSAVDAVLDQIRKKPKLSVLDKTKKDWGEFKEENKGMEEQLDAYKKSANQYTDKVSFLQRTDYREFERERDARLALHSKKRPDMREDP